jgi:hypothetical protein
LLLGVLSFKEEELGDYYCAYAVVYGAVKADYALLEEAGEYIVRVPSSPNRFVDKGSWGVVVLEWGG